jgi:hypothetical protein
MGNRLRSTESGATVLLFGPLALSFDQVAFDNLRNIVVENDEYRWILETIAGLPQCWKTITEALPGFQAGPGFKQLEDLRTAFEIGKLESSFPLPNILLNPLVVITHLTQYSKYLETTSLETDERIDLYASSKSNSETLGFCTGFLSSIAVSSSQNKEQFWKYGAAAIRLGMLIGMIVDAQDAAEQTGTSKSLSVVWNSAQGGEELTRILKSYPEVCEYIQRPKS